MKISVYELTTAFAIIDFQFLQNDSHQPKSICKSLLNTLVIVLEL